MPGERQYFATKRYNKNVLEFLEFLDRKKSEKSGIGCFLLLVPMPRPARSNFTKRPGEICGQF